MTNIIGVVSGKGGVGKTTFSINLAVALNELGRDCILVDADVSNPNVTLHLGIPSVQLTLQDVLNGEVKIQHSIFLHPCGLKIIPSSISMPKDNMSLFGLKEILTDLNEWVIIDSPPGLDENINVILDAADSIIVVTNPEMAAVTDAIKTIKLAKDMHKNNISVVINRVRNDSYELTSDEIELVCETPIISTISEDENVRKAGFETMPVIHRSPYAHATIDFKYLAARLLRMEYEPPGLLFLRRLISR